MLHGYRDKLHGIEGRFREAVQTLVLTYKEKCVKGAIKEHEGASFVSIHMES